MKWLIIAISLVWGSIAMAQDVTDGRLTVTGEGRIDSAPDMATITLGVTSEADTAAAALRETSEATAEVLALLKQAGLAARDMQTRDLSLSPLWNNSSSSSQPKINGYQAGNNVMVRVRALDTLGMILDTVVQGGANQFHGLSFGLQNPGPVQDDARRAAVAEALRKAKLYAEAAGITLGPILELNESGGSAPQPEMMGRMAAVSVAVPVAGGEVSTVAQVTMVFQIDGN